VSWLSWYFSWSSSFLQCHSNFLKLAFRFFHAQCDNQSMFKNSRRCFCAFCRSTRIVYTKRHISVIDIVMAAVASIAIRIMVWQDLDPRACIFFALALGLAEIFIVFRWRLSIACPHCGFDPVLYKRSSEKAALRVTAHMSERRLRPLSVFSPPPTLPMLRRRAHDPKKSLGASR